MDLKVAGKVVELLEEQSGTGRNGPWRKRDFIIETQDNYPKKICITQWGDDIDSNGLNVGDLITVSIDIQSREFNGRWYTDVRAWRIEREKGVPNTPERTEPEEEIPNFDDDDDLPF